MDSWEQLHLEWMFDNQPHLVRQLFRTGELREHLILKVDQGLYLWEKLKKEGWHPDEAKWVVFESVLAPADGPEFSDNPPKPLPERERALIYKRLEEEEEKEQT